MHEGVVIAIGQITPVSARPDDVVIDPATSVLPLPYRIRWTLRTDRAFVPPAWCNIGRASFNSFTAVHRHRHVNTQLAWSVVTRWSGGIPRKGRFVIGSRGGA